MTAKGRPGPHDPLSTLPSEELPDDMGVAGLRLTAVIAFHPDPSRIGESWHGSLDVAESKVVMGRDSPMFSRGGSDTGGLEDRHISRDAFTVEARDEQWVLGRRPGSSRLRLNGRELVEERRFSGDEFKEGVILTLGMRVVLHLRLEPMVERTLVPKALEEALPGVGSAARELRQRVLAAACNAGDVLLIGPTGSGKEHVARAVHGIDDASAKPWVAVNMAALPGEIAAASLFGVRKGAYTGADQHRPGYFQQAEGGSLFLDEIADAPATVQPLLLRALQEREVQVVGGAVVKVSLRVIAAMEWDPDQDPRGLRPALRYRLGSHEIRLPALADRIEDVGLLTMMFIEDLRPDSGPRPWATADSAAVARWALCFESLLLYDWPGNIRELKQLVGQLAAAGLERPVLPERLRYAASVNHARGEIAETQASPGDAHSPGTLAAGPPSLNNVDDEAFLEAWIDAGFSPTGLARSLGVSRAAVYRRVQRTEACRLAGDVPLGELLAVLDQCRGDLEETAGKLAVSSRGLATRLRASGIRTQAEGSPGKASFAD